MCYQREKSLFQNWLAAQKELKAQERKNMTGEEIYKAEQRRIKRIERRIFYIFLAIVIAITFLCGRACAQTCHTIPIVAHDRKMIYFTHDGTPTTLPQDPPTTVDVMILWTPQAQIGAGGAAQILAQVNRGIALANKAELDSQTGVQIALVYAGVWKAAENSVMDNNLYQLHADADVDALRDKYGADMVCGITETSDGPAGVACLMSYNSNGFADWAYSITQRKYATSYYSLLHEMFGHNRGCQHDKAHADSFGCYAFSYGFLTANYGDIMAYPSNQTRLPLFSNGGRFLYQSPAGTAIVLGDQDADNARTIQLTSVTVANFRQHKVIALPTATPTPTPTATPKPIQGADFVSFPATVDRLSTVQITWQLTGPKQVQVWIDGPVKRQISPGSYIGNSGSFQWLVNAPIGSYAVFVKGWDRVARVTGTAKVAVQ